MKLKTYTSGAKRDTDADKVRLDLNCPTAYLRWGGISAEGAEKYGEHNWTKGMPLGDTLNHAERHLTIAKRGGDGEGPPVLHLAKALWNIAALIHFLEDCHCEQPLSGKGSSTNPARVRRGSKRS